MSTMQKGAILRKCLRAYIPQCTDPSYAGGHLKETVPWGTIPCLKRTQENNILLWILNVEESKNCIL